MWGGVLYWIKSFIRGQTQCVNVDGTKSTWCDVWSGILQGFVIGLILFVIFINDMPFEVKHNFCKVFADDCKLFGNVKYDKENTVQLNLTKLVDWSKRWQQLFSAKKRTAMHLGTNNPKLAYQMNGHTLENISSVKDLGC